MSTTPDAYLADEWDEPQAEDADTFRVETAQMADWALRKLRAFLAKTEQDHDLAETEHALIDEWLRKETAKVDDRIRFFRGLLADWHRRQLAADPHAKTIALPAGSLVARKQPDRVEIADPDGFCDAYQGTALVTTKTTHAPDKRNLLTLLHNEPDRHLDGVTLVAGEVTFKQEVATS